MIHELTNMFVIGYACGAFATLLTVLWLDYEGKR